MSADDIRDLLKEYRKAVENVSGGRLVKMVLYGSYARGDFRPESDVDIMILLDEDMEGISAAEKEIYGVTYDFNEAHNMDIMPVVQSNSHFNRWKKADMFYHNVEKEGVAI